jgi:signal transduction histidine kinase
MAKLKGFHPMSELRNARSETPRTLPEAAIRTLRHEIGDFLQTVYASAAILSQRLPKEWELERRILGDMRTRGEACKRLIDLTHDLVCPMALIREPVDFAEILAPLVANANASHPKVRIQIEQTKIPTLKADSQRLMQAAQSVLMDACESASNEVRVSLGLAEDGRYIQWRVQRDGEAIAKDRLQHYFGPGTKGYQGPESLAMILVGMIVEQHGGRIQASNPPEGGVSVAAFLPIDQAAIK